MQQLGKQIAGKKDPPPPHMLKGVVTAVDAVAHTCSVKIGGSDTAISGIKFLAAYWPQPNDNVYLWQNGPDLFVVDKLYNGATAWHIIGAAGEPAFQNLWSPIPGTSAYYKRVGEMVSLNARLQINTGGTANTVACQLPVGYRPISSSWFAGYSQCEWYIDSNGSVIPITANAVNLYYLSGTWPVA